MTGGKKLNLTITSTNARRLNANNTGPLFLKLGRAEVVKGCIVVKGIDHAIGLEIAVSLLFWRAGCVKKRRLKLTGNRRFWDMLKLYFTPEDNIA